MFIGRTNKERHMKVLGIGIIIGASLFCFQVIFKNIFHDSSIVILQPNMEPNETISNHANKDKECMDFAVANGLVKVSIEEIVKDRPITVHLKQDDERIVNLIRKTYLKKPSNKRYNLKKKDGPKGFKDTSMGQGQFIRKLFKNKRNGFFIETGALDGETRSNTLYLEKELGWNGLLIEADPNNYKKIIQKNRKAWTSNTCVATKPYPHEVHFKQNFNMGKILINHSSIVNDDDVVVVQCFPIYSYLMALGISTVDYLSLDIEGFELQVLKNIPFNKIYIKALSIEFSKNRRKKMMKFMESKKYLLAGQVISKYGLAHDLIFVHQKIAGLLNITKN